MYESCWDDRRGIERLQFFGRFLVFVAGDYLNLLRFSVLQVEIDLTLDSVAGVSYNLSILVPGDFIISARMLRQADLSVRFDRSSRVFPLCCSAHSAIKRRELSRFTCYCCKLFAAGVGMGDIALQHADAAARFGPLDFQVCYKWFDVVGF